MKILLDTCTFLWIITEAKDLSPTAKEVFKDPTNEVFLSAVSTWEMAVKHMIGKLPLPEAAERFVPNQRKRHSIDPLPLNEEATFHLLKLPPLHRDPFDRMLMSQAIEHEMTLLTPDPLIQQYPVRTLW